MKEIDEKTAGCFLHIYGQLLRCRGIAIPETSHIDLDQYHWNLSGVGLPDPILKRIYRGK